MKITSNFPEKVYYRFFEKTDTGYWSGLADGWIETGKNIEWEDHNEEVKLEFKKGDALGPFIIKPGQLFSRDDEVTLTDRGRLVKTELEFFEDPKMTETYYGTSIQFFDLLNSQISVEKNSTFSISNAITTSESKEKTEGTTHTFGIDVSGTITKGSKTDKKEASIGAKYELEVMNKLVEQYSKSTQELQQSSESHKFVAPGGKLTAVMCHWHKVERTGKAVRGSLTYTYRVPHSFRSDIEIQEFSSVDEMPKELKAVFSKRK